MCDWPRVGSPSTSGRTGGFSCSLLPCVSSPASCSAWRRRFVCCSQLLPPPLPAGAAQREVPAGSVWASYWWFRRSPCRCCWWWAQPSFCGRSRTLHAQDLGIERHRLLMVWSAPGRQDAALSALIQTIQSRLAALPGVLSASMTSHGFLRGDDGGGMSEFLKIQGREPKPGMRGDHRRRGARFLRRRGDAHRGRTRL